jgi:hypothetical protein
LDDAAEVLDELGRGGDGVGCQGGGGRRRR